MTVHHGRMSVRIGGMSYDDFERERAALREAFIEATAKHDQALAELLLRSNWTQGELAGALRRDQSYVARRLLFGRFLEFLTTGANSETLPSDLTERKFRTHLERTYWERDSDKFANNDRRRFLNIVRRMQESKTRR